MKTIYEKFRRGDHITDDELIALLRTLKDATPALELSLEFKLFHNQILAHIRALEGYAFERRIVY